MAAGDLSAALERLPGGGVDDVAQHPRRGAVLLLPPREHGERRRVGLEPHVRLLDADEPLDRGAVEVDALGERLLGLVGRHGDVLDRPEDVGELEAEEVDVLLVDGVQYVLFDRVDAAMREFEAYVATLGSSKTKEIY